MRSFLALGLPVIFISAAAAQVGAPFSSQSNALGGRFGAQAMARPLGGITPGVPNRGGAAGRDHNGRGPRQGAVLPYATAWYVPNYFDTFGDYGTPSSVATYGAEYGPGPIGPPPVIVPPPAAAPSAPPVIINQYFNGPQPSGNAQAAPQQPASANVQPSGEPLGPVDNYYLIAYKNHSVYAALSWWVEGKTLHYVTTRNTHNQASLDLIDVDLTKNLNQARDIPFTLPAQ